MHLYIAALQDSQVACDIKCSLRQKYQISVCSLIKSAVLKNHLIQLLNTAMSVTVYADAVTISSLNFLLFGLTYH